MATEIETLERNQELTDAITGGRVKQASDAVTDYTRTRITEEGFMGKFLPQIPITDADLVPDVNDPRPMVVVEKQANSPGAVSVPFATAPRRAWLKAPRYAVTMSRIVTNQFQIDVDYLRSYKLDLRQQVSDQAVRDISTEEDASFIETINSVLVAPDTNLPAHGNNPLWKTISGGFTREVIKEVKGVLRVGPASLSAEKMLMNHITILEYEAMYREEIGGDLAEDIFKNGFTEGRHGGVELYSTIKRALVPDDSIYLFAGDKFIGKNFVLRDTVMHIKAEHFMVQFFAYKTAGAAIGNITGIGRVDIAE